MRSKGHLRLTPSDKLEASTDAQSPKSRLRKPEQATVHSPLAVGLVAVYVAVHEDKSENDPCRRKQSCGLWIEHAGKHHGQDGLGHVLQKLTMGSLRTVESICCFAVLGLFGRRIRIRVRNTSCFAYAAHNNPVGHRYHRYHAQCNDRNIA